MVWLLYILKTEEVRIAVVCKWKEKPLCHSAHQFVFTQISS